jgi:hypothetical protein
MPTLLILAAEAAADVSSYLPAVSTLGSLGFAVWYAYYTTTVAIPKLLDAIVPNDWSFSSASTRPCTN